MQATTNRWTAGRPRRGGSDQGKDEQQQQERKIAPSRFDPQQPSQWAMTRSASRSQIVHSTASSGGGGDGRKEINPPTQEKTHETQEGRTHDFPSPTASDVLLRRGKGSDKVLFPFLFLTTHQGLHLDARPSGDVLPATRRRRASLVARPKFAAGCLFHHLLRTTTR